MTYNRGKQVQKKAALKHTQLMLKKLKEWSTEFTTDKAPDTFREMDAERGNMNKALARLTNPNSQIPPELVRDLALTLYDYYNERSLWQEWIELGKLGLEVCQQLGDFHSLNEVYPALCNGLGIAQRMLGNKDEAMSYYQLALEQANRDEEKSDTLTNMCDIHRLRGETEQALQCAQKAIEFAMEIRDKDREAKGLEYMGLTYVGCQDYDRGIVCYEKALHLRETTGNLPRKALTLTFLVFALTHRGKDEDLKQALNYYKQAYGIETQLDNWQSLARLRGDIAVAYNKLGQYREAINLSEESFYHNRRIGFWRGATLNQARLAQSYFGLENFEQAIDSADYVRKHQEQLTAFDRSNLSGFGGVLVSLAQYLQESGNQKKATEYAKVAIEFSKASGEGHSLQAAKQFLQQMNSPATFYLKNN